LRRLVVPMSRAREAALVSDIEVIGVESLVDLVATLRGEAVPARTNTQHMLVTPANVFREYPPTDLN